MSSRLKVGDKAPSFSASSTQGLVNLKITKENGSFFYVIHQSLIIGEKMKLLA